MSHFKRGPIDEHTKMSILLYYISSRASDLPSRHSSLLVWIVIPCLVDNMP